VQASKEKVTRLEEKGALVLALEPDERGWIPQDVLWKSIAELGVTSILVEGGNAVHTECLKNGFVDRLCIFMAPKILGSGIDAIGDLGIRNINSALKLEDLKIKQVGVDFMITGNFDVHRSG
jgi:riboflavin biosynthesis pyrimidine reductase